MNEIVCGVSRPVGPGEGDGDRDGQEMLAESSSELEAWLAVTEGGWIKTDTHPAIGQLSFTSPRTA